MQRIYREEIKILTYTNAVRQFRLILVVYLQLSNIIGQLCMSRGNFCNFIGHDRVAVILQQLIARHLVCVCVCVCVCACEHTRVQRHINIAAVDAIFESIRLPNVQ